MSQTNRPVWREELVFSVDNGLRLSVALYDDGLLWDTPLGEGSIDGSAPSPSPPAG